MARPKSAFLGALGTAFQIGKAITDAVLEEGGDDESLRKIIADPGLAKDLALRITDKARLLVRDTSGKWPLKRFGSKIIGFENIADNRHYDLGQLVTATSDRSVPPGTSGHIIGFADPSKEECFIKVLFYGKIATDDVKPEEIKA